MRLCDQSGEEGVLERHHRNTYGKMIVMRDERLRGIQEETDRAEREIAAPAHGAVARKRPDDGGRTLRRVVRVNLRQQNEPGAIADEKPNRYQLSKNARASHIQKIKSMDFSREEQIAMVDNQNPTSYISPRSAGLS